jgi:hypothetical protein
MLGQKMLWNWNGLQCYFRYKTHKKINYFDGQSGSERSYLEDREKLCAKIDINKEEWKFVTLF